MYRLVSVYVGQCVDQLVNKRVDKEQLMPIQSAKKVDMEIQYDGLVLKICLVSRCLICLTKVIMFAVQVLCCAMDSCHLDHYLRLPLDHYR